MLINSKEYSCFELFALSEEGEHGEVILTDTKTNEKKVKKSGRHNYTLVKFSLNEHSQYRIELVNTKVSIAYLSGCHNIYEKGVTFVEISKEDNIEKQKNLSQWYDSPYREQYHFGPYKNWINDPNGLCYYKGYYHLYYQANPHGQQWSNMYWGHAASKDLIHWTHLPYVLFPQNELIESKSLKGGAYSGCAVALEDKIQFYLTRHIGPWDDCNETVQYQIMVSSTDGLVFGEEVRIIDKPNEDFSFNFRDPKVFYHEDKWKMVIGSKVKDIPAILMYESDDMKNFQYKGEVITEREEGVYTIECPDLFELDGKFVAVAAYMFYTDAQGRIQPTYYYIGELKNNKLEIESKGLYDFGSNFYAVQSFEHENRRIAIGWLSDFYNEHVVEENGAYGSMSLPRELTVKNNKLFMKPVKEVYNLRDELICNEEKENVNIENIEKNAYYAQILFNEICDFNILLGKNEESSISLERNNGILKIKTKGVKSSSADFIANVNDVRSIEIFVDRRAVEVFINNGEAAGAKVFYTQNNVGVFSTEFSNLNLVENIKIYTMKSIW